jgi:hypothetical protein
MCECGCKKMNRKRKTKTTQPKAYARKTKLAKIVKQTQYSGLKRNRKKTLKR